MSVLFDERINYKYLYPQKKEWVMSNHNNPFKKRNDIKAIYFDNATILPLKTPGGYKHTWGKGGLIDNNLNYVELSGIYGLIKYSYDYDQCDYIDKTVVYCGYFKMHWGDFIAYCLPRLWYALKNDSSIEEYVFFVNENTTFELSGNYKLILKHLGILNKVRFVSKPTKFSKVILPEMSYDVSHYYSEEYLNTLECINSHIEAYECETYEKIFLTRSNLKKSILMESGVEMLDNFFQKNGFKVISPEQITVDKMIALMDGAKTIACISGTLPHNLLLAKRQAEGKTLINIDRNAWFNRLQYDTDKMLKCNIIHLDGNVTLYPVELSYGPFIFAWNDIFKKFAEDHNMFPPDDKYTCEKYKKKLFRQYIKAYRNEFGLCLFLPDFIEHFDHVLFEGYRYGEKFFWDYLKGIKPYKFSQYCSSFYIKSILRKLLKR